MNKYDSKQKFEDLTLPSYYLRVNKIHPLDLYLGLTDDGRKAIRLIGAFKRSKVKSSKIIEVNHLQFEDKTILSFSLVDKRFEDIFYIFCNDLIDSSSLLNSGEGYQFIVNRFEKWRSFGQANRNILNESEIKGLIGELLFLNDYAIENYGENVAIDGWTGTEPTKKDFYFDRTWFEIKVTTNNKVQISSIEQLLSDDIGTLVVFKLEKQSPESQGISLNLLINQIKEKLTSLDAFSSFMLKLYNAGYYFYEDFYDSFVYQIKEQLKFSVNKDFPVIKRDSLNPAIEDVKYTLILNLLTNFLEE